MFGQRMPNVRMVAAGATGLILATGVVLVGPASATSVAAHGRAQKPSHGGGSSAPPPLVYGGGKLVASSTTYSIWWGPAASFPNDAQAGITQLLEGFGGSSYLAIANQYMRSAYGTTASSNFFGTPLSDQSAPPSRSPTVSAIVGEVAKVLAANHLSADSNAVYLVYTSNFPHAKFCAWHAAGTIGTATVQVAYLPNTAGVSGCDPGDLFPGANPYSEGTRSLADSTAHEFMESVTDPVPVTGWADKNGQEIGDKCNFVYDTSAPITLANNSEWQIQEEWSNSADGGAGGCVPGA